MHPDDLKNPEYRKGRHCPVEVMTRQPVRRRPPKDIERRAQFAIQAARAEFGRFYWNGELDRRMERELAMSRLLKRKTEQARRRKHGRADR